MLQGRVALTHANYDCTCVLDASLIWAGQSCWEDTVGISLYLYVLWDVSPLVPLPHGWEGGSQ